MIPNPDAVKENIDQNKFLHGKIKNDQSKRNDKLGTNFAIYALEGCMCTREYNIKAGKKKSSPRENGQNI